VPGGHLGAQDRRSKYAAVMNGSVQPLPAPYRNTFSLPVQNCSDLLDFGSAMQNQFHTRNYSVFLLLSHPDATPLWFRDRWMGVVPKLSPLMMTDRGKALARVVQLRPGLGSPNKRAVKSGPVGWNEKSHCKWTHDRANASGGDPEFRSVQFWAPGGPECERSGRPPEAFFSLAQESEPKEGRQYGYMVALAVAEDREDLVDDRDAAIEGLSSIMRPVLIAKSRRTWGRGHANPPSEWQNSINDTFFVSGLFKPGKMHVESVSLNSLRGAWDPLG
jgi:hypothetical protein